MGKDVAKSKGNTARRSMQRNNGLPGGVYRNGRKNMIGGKDRYSCIRPVDIFNGSDSLFTLKRKGQLLRRWGCTPEAARDATNPS